MRQKLIKNSIILQEFVKNGVFAVAFFVKKR